MNNVAMDHTRKMALVDPQKLEALQHTAAAAVTHNNTQHLGTISNTVSSIASPVTAALNNLDQEMRGILDNQEYSEDEKVKHYNHTLQRYLAYKKQNEQPAGVRIISKESVKTAEEEGEQEDKTNELLEKEIIDSVPQKYRRKAALLLSTLKIGDVVGWSKEGQPNTHIGNLINDAVRSRKQFNPYGWETFAKGLDDRNVPQDLIGNKRRWDWIQRRRGVMVNRPGEKEPQRKDWIHY